MLHRKGVAHQEREVPTVYHIPSEASVSEKPAALEVKPGVDRYVGAVGKQTDAKVIYNADFRFWELKSSCSNGMQQSRSKVACQPAILH